MFTPILNKFFVWLVGRLVFRICVLRFVVLANTREAVQTNRTLSSVPAYGENVCVWRGVGVGVGVGYRVEGLKLKILQIDQSFSLLKLRKAEYEETYHERNST